MADDVDLTTPAIAKVFDDVIARHHITNPAEIIALIQIAGVMWAVGTDEGVNRVGRALIDLVNECDRIAAELRGQGKH